MKTGLFGQQLTLMEELRAASFLAHARLQTAPFFQALAACQLPLESYVGQLRALAVIHSVLEQALDSCPDARVAAVWNHGLGRLPRLLQDLRFFEPRAVADLKEAAEAALKTAEGLRLRSMEKPLSLLGALYVLEGSALGAVILQPLYARAFLLTGTEGLSYLHSVVPAVYRNWAQYQQRMNGLCLSATEREQMTEAANDLFAQLNIVFQALYPFRAESRTVLATSLNPEAGRHPVPADPREIAAALRAGDDCWQQFPYFEQRYGERGQRFARSDAAWLATLGQYDATQVTQQVRWLGRVLAGRGMPTLLLQVQLEILATALTAAVPAKATDYAKLAQAAAELGARRHSHLSDTQLQALATHFADAVGPEWNTRLPRTSDLLACAVADELDGNDLAVASLQPWLTDAGRFPAAWITAVEATVATARQQACPGANTGPNQPEVR
jgi:heme oxygenase